MKIPRPTLSSPSLARGALVFVVLSCLFYLYANLDLELSTSLTICLWFIPAIILIAWLAIELRKLSIRRRHIQETGIRPILAMSQPQFEHSLLQAYRQLGYRAKVVSDETKYPGVDIELTRPSEKIFVQYRNWRTHRIDLSQIRQLLLTAANHGATKGIVITTGFVTSPAARFAQASPTKIDLIDARALKSLLLPPVAPRDASFDHSQTDLPNVNRPSQRLPHRKRSAIYK
jgi:hypothetical protein